MALREFMLAAALTGCSQGARSLEDTANNTNIGNFDDDKGRNPEYAEDLANCMAKVKNGSEIAFDMQFEAKSDVEFGDTNISGFSMNENGWSNNAYKFDFIDREWCQLSDDGVFLEVFQVIGDDNDAPDSNDVLAIVQRTTLGGNWTTVDNVKSVCGPIGVPGIGTDDVIPYDKAFFCAVDMQDQGDAPDKMKLVVLDRDCDTYLGRQRYDIQEEEEGYDVDRTDWVQSGE
ncbi:hypothetical protein KKC94_01400 [Patescibacteria group bacterium]|nr:hypothetical protein [Patescibacteria group bacterium]